MMISIMMKNNIIRKRLLPALSTHSLIKNFSFIKPLTQLSKQVIGSKYQQQLVTCQKSYTQRYFGVASASPSLSQVLSAEKSQKPLATNQQKLLHQKSPQKIRNIAIIAHVDHGKTTLVDCLLRQTGIAFNQERAMDSNALQQQRGITILSKCTSVTYNGYKINIVDTPGHSDFGGQVQRIMSMVDGVCLVVCATQGPMPQTKFVLSKALQQNLRPIVVINKVDRETARVTQVQNEIFDLFCSLNADDSLLEYPQIYASAKNGWATSSLDDDQSTGSVKDLLNAVIETVPPPETQSTPDDDLVMLVSQTESNPIFGKTLIGRIYSGSIGVGDKLHSITSQYNGQQEQQSLKTVESGRIIKVLKRYGTQNIELNRAYAGDIVSIAGFTKSTATHTINTIGKYTRIPSIPIDPPMISMTININNSPIQGKDGSKLTLIQMREWLKCESENDVSLFLENDPQNKNIIRLKGRGDLHLGILIEKMRRDGFELAIEPPQVITKLDGAGNTLQPIQRFSLQCDLNYMNKIVEKMMPRKGELISSQEIGDQAEQRIKLTFTIPSRGLIGLKANVIQQTKGNCIIQSQFLAYQSYRGEIIRNNKGAIISTAAGITSAYALKDIETKGTLFLGPGVDTYEGMVIGEHVLESDIEMNPAKTKKLTNIRAAGNDENIRLQTPRIFSLEDAVAYIRDDELLEVTPKALRIRKQILNTNERRKKKKEQKNKKK